VADRGVARIMLGEEVQTKATREEITPPPHIGYGSGRGIAAPQIKVRCFVEKRRDLMHVSVLTKI